MIVLKLTSLASDSSSLLLFGFIIDERMLFLSAFYLSKNVLRALAFVAAFAEDLFVKPAVVNRLTNDLCVVLTGYAV